MLKLIKDSEGCKLKAYKCPADKWTIGFGNTFYEDGDKVKEGDTITKEEAYHLFYLISTKFEKLFSFFILLNIEKTLFILFI